MNSPKNIVTNYDNYPALYRSFYLRKTNPGLEETAFDERGGAALGDLAGYRAGRILNGGGASFHGNQWKHRV